MLAAGGAPPLRRALALQSVAPPPEVSVLGRLRASFGQASVAGSGSSGSFPGVAPGSGSFRTKRAPGAASGAALGGARLHGRLQGRLQWRLQGHAARTVCNLAMHRDLARDFLSQVSGE